MLGMSLSKILFTILMIVAVWQTYRQIRPWLEKLQQREAPPRRPAPGPSARAQQAGPAQPRPVDLAACPHCGTFVPRGTFCPDRDHCRVRHG
ncbi:MAG: hypothetical protein U1E14_00695 [Geminicoccaceae bacterium]